MLSILCILDHCIHLLYQADALCQIDINLKDTTLTCFGKDILSSASTVC
jgi:hypothetical protein